MSRIDFDDPDVQLALIILDFCQRFGMSTFFRENSQGSWGVLGALTFRHDDAITRAIELGLMDHEPKDDGTQVARINETGTRTLADYGDWVLAKLDDD